MFKIFAGIGLFNKLKDSSLWEDGIINGLYTLIVNYPLQCFIILGGIILFYVILEYISKKFVKEGQ